MYAALTRTTSCSAVLLQSRNSWIKGQRTRLIGSWLRQSTCKYKLVLDALYPFMKLTACPRIGADWALGLMQYGQRWRDYRRAMWQHLHPGALSRYQPVQLAISHLLLVKLLRDPLNFKAHISL